MGYVGKPTHSVEVLGHLIMRVTLAVGEPDIGVHVSWQLERSSCLLSATARPVVLIGRGGSPLEEPRAWRNVCARRF